MKAEIEVNGRHASIKLDGQDVAMAVRGFRLSAAVDDEPRLELDLGLFEDSTVSGEVEVVIPAAMATLLRQLGWTAPEEMRETP